MHLNKNMSLVKDIAGAEIFINAANNLLAETEKKIEQLQGDLRNTKSTLEAVKNALAEMKVAEQKTQPEQPRLERWKPEKFAIYYAIRANGETVVWNFQNIEDEKILDFYNCFQTKEEAAKEALRTRARRKLEWFARELNKGKLENENWWIESNWGIALKNEGVSIVSCQGEWATLGVIRFAEKSDAEYALSQMTQQELEALR